MRSEVVVAKWSAAEIAHRTGGTLSGEAGAQAGAIITDSRDSTEGAAFFALDGERSRGIEFVPLAFGSGCTVVVVPRDWSGTIPAGAAAISVDDPLAALARLATSVRAGWSCPVVAITGSSGKTTVKEMAAHVLSGQWDVLRSPGNYNTVVGLARTLAGLAAEPPCAVLEVGASETGEVARLGAIVQPTVAAVINVGAAHLDGFGDLDVVAREKMSLLAAVTPSGTRIIPGDDERLTRLADAMPGVFVRVGTSPTNDWFATDVEPGAIGTRFRLNGSTPVVVSVPGEHQVTNALFVLAIADALGVPQADAISRLATFEGVAGRLTIRRAGDVVVIDDTYNANPASMDAALGWFERYTPAPRKAVVLGDMLELGPDSAAFHAELGRRVAGSALDLAVFVGEESRAAFEEGTRRLGDRQWLRHVSDSEKAAHYLQSWVRPGDVVLVKGSRGMRMERVVRGLLEGEARDAL